MERGSIISGCSTNVYDVYDLSDATDHSGLGVLSTTLYIHRWVSKMAMYQHDDACTDDVIDRGFVDWNAGSTIH